MCIRDRECAASRYLAFTLPSDRFLTFLDAVLYQILVIEQKMLFQTVVGDIAPLCSFLYRDVAAVSYTHLCQ